jgi:hypothetical protein
MKGKFLLTLFKSNYLYERLFSKRLLYVTTVENSKWIAAEKNGPFPTNNKLYKTAFFNETKATVETCRIVFLEKCKRLQL